ncbi:Uncharacterised protein [Vibrio cholerae]|uniref:Uncharacterized protein n=1 Tax=Vibrio cholerae TaxID=666 RepID=A0A656AV96_VIBCL|nr:Uncharacterised protein [Vibrio cholerae]
MASLVLNLYLSHHERLQYVIFSTTNIPLFLITTYHPRY